MNKIVIAAVGIIVVVGIGYFLLSSSNNQQSSQDITIQALPTEAIVEDNEPTPEGEEVELTVNGFSPESITIKAGTTATWINKSGKTATVNSNPHPIHTSFPELNLGSFEDGETLSFTFNERGTYGIHNHLQAAHKATIIVE